MATTRYWNWGSKVKVEVSDDGEIDDNAMIAFMRGQCHALALALHEATDWPIVALIRECEGDAPDTPGHCAVLTPDGDTLDIGGLQAKERYRHGMVVEITKITPAEVRKFKHYMEPDVHVARPFVANVLKLAGITQFQMPLPFVAGKEISGGTKRTKRTSRTTRTRQRIESR